ncbi:hypothetical protein AAG570_003349 [Ranatra chinensis]|uniref:Spaetzle domain-containing protein n=1 Tax=Ranatra chinensis TaxID=642074 RepID=A0ABD0Y3Z3_9HEMI
MFYNKNKKQETTENGRVSLQELLQQMVYLPRSVVSCAEYAGPNRFRPIAIFSGAVRVVEKLVFPKSAKNKEDVWMFIVNQDQYQQGVRIEICVKASQGGTGEQCSFTESFPLGYQTSCKQKYIYRKLLAVDRKSGETVADTFQLPSCCSCTVKQNLINRVGVPVNRSPKSTQPPPKQENKT